MTRRDAAWRSAGLGLIAAALAIGGLARADASAVPGILAFVLTVVALVLLFQGRRVGAAFRIERGRHRELAAVVRARHHAARRGR